MQSEDYKIEELQRLLLQEDRDTTNALKQELEDLKLLIETEKELDGKVGPIITKYLNLYTEDIPEKLGPTITKTLKNEIEKSKDTIVDALYPIIGKLIKRYIQKEFQKLSDKINYQVNHRFSLKSIARKLKSIFTGVKEEDIIISELSDTQIQEVFVVEKNSGILKGSFSKTNTIDKEVLSGMLTAIKSFVEDALKTGDEQLETIEYGLYNIYIQNFKTYYIAVVLHGVFDSTFKEKLEEDLLTFSQKHYKASKSRVEISESLKDMFS
ncbi:MAG: cell envelope biogenesis protein OmpA [Winogradskyella sp.]|uniref:cell envelope biogenesis protein OmpA n=1 Tax=Winogradskyella sp. TaxID=1883156 RepID=UPI000F3C554B|nr:cell envelope biogenesis protein OmpA [Winogradskyella sp.]RNC84949.1 MAG: cell envelope biogenesis protein OmpA [Winogradskyella sp.]